jgi:hypothetical protein
MNREEKFVCEMIWGGVPLDQEWAKGTNIFQRAMRDFKNGKWNDLFNSEQNPERSVARDAQSGEQKLETKK